MIRPGTEPRRPSTSSRLRAAARWAGNRSLSAAPPDDGSAHTRGLAELSDAVTVRVGSFDLVLW